MPYVNIRVTRENGTPTAEQKAEQQPHSKYPM